jgi:nitrogenase molybdenum-cofactor synthesis protein NifE
MNGPFCLTGKSEDNIIVYKLENQPKGVIAMKSILTNDILEERKKSIFCNSEFKINLKCESNSIAGSISQRACVYCGARVVLNPITDAFHLVHGPIGCASYTWDIRGSLSSGADTYRNSFSTDLREENVIFGGEKKLEAAIDEIVQKFSPKLIFDSTAITPVKNR